MVKKNERNKIKDVFVFFTVSISALLFYNILRMYFSVGNLYFGEDEVIQVYFFDYASFLAGLILILITGACYLLTPNLFRKQKKGRVL